MKNHLRYSTIALTVYLMIFIPCFGQGGPKKGTVAPGKVETQSPVGPEERTVRDTYQKLTNLNKASFNERFKPAVALDEDSYLRFELSNFHVGPIQDILGKRYNDLVSGATGEIIQLVRSSSSLNEENPQVCYKAQWSPGQYA